MHAYLTSSTIFRTFLFKHRRWLQATAYVFTNLVSLQWIIIGTCQINKSDKLVRFMIIEILTHARRDRGWNPGPSK